jgi:hypothetical protein
MGFDFSIKCVNILNALFQQLKSFKNYPELRITQIFQRR